MGTAITDFRPMLAKAEIRAALEMGHFPDRDWVMEPKHDGMRAVVEVDSDLPGGIRISSRSGLGYTDHLHDVHKEWLISIVPDKTILDGELAAIKRFVDVIDTDGTSKEVPVVDFNRTMRIMGSGADKARDKQKDGLVTFLVFDVVKWNGDDLTGSSWASRRYLLESIDGFDRSALPGNVTHFVNPVFNISALTYDTFLENKIEGVIVKNRSAAYVPGKRPSKTWVKIKAEKTFDVVVTGFTDGKGKYEGQIGAIEYGAYDKNGDLQYVGRCSGMDDAERKIWTQARDIWDEDEHAGVYVIEVKANELVGSGEYRTPRHPQYVVLRTDKKPEECTMEQFKEEDR